MKRTAPQPRRRSVWSVVTALAVAMGLFVPALLAATAAQAAPATASVHTVSATSAPAAKATTASPAYGKWHGTTWVGTRKINAEQRMVCIEFPKLRPYKTNKVVNDKNSLRGSNAGQSKRMKALANKYSRTTSNKTAEALARAIWTIEGSSAFKQWSKGHRPSSSVAKLVKSMIAESKALVGKTVVSVASDGGFAGTDGTATIRVVRSGKPVAGATVKVTAQNAKLYSSSVVTNSKGIATAKFRIGSGLVTITATHTSYSATEVWTTLPSSRHQTMIGGKFTTTASGKVSFLMQAGAPSINFVCDTNCTGLDVPATVQACNKVTKSGKLLTNIVYVNGKAVVRLDVPKGACKEASFKVDDAQTITTKACVTSKAGGKCESPLVAVGKPVQVVCPGWAEASITIACACDKRVSGVSFLAPKSSTRSYTGYVLVNSRIIEVPLVNGVPKAVDIGYLKVGDVVTVGFKVKSPVIDQPLRTILVTA